MGTGVASELVRDWGVQGIIELHCPHLRLSARAAKGFTSPLEPLQKKAILMLLLYGRVYGVHIRETLHSEKAWSSSWGCLEGHWEAFWKVPVALFRRLRVYPTAFKTLLSSAWSCGRQTCYLWCRVSCSTLCACGEMSGEYNSGPAKQARPRIPRRLFVIPHARTHTDCLSNSSNELSTNIMWHNCTLSW